MDEQEVRTAIQQKANVLLQDVNDENLGCFAREVKSVAEWAWRRYVLCVCALYTQSPRTLNEPHQRADFTDSQTGYQAQMLAWMHDEPLQLVQRTIPRPTRPVRRPLPEVTLAGGTIMATSLLATSHPLLAGASTVSTLALSFVLHRRHLRLVQAYNYAVFRYEIALRRKKRDLVEAYTEDTLQWLRLGVFHSRQVLKERYRL